MSTFRLKDNHKTAGIKVAVKHAGDEKQSVGIIFLKGEKILFSLDAKNTGVLITRILQLWRGERPENLPCLEGEKIAIAKEMANAMAARNKIEDLNPLEDFSLPELVRETRAYVRQQRREILKKHAKILGQKRKK